MNKKLFFNLYITQILYSILGYFCFSYFHLSFFKAGFTYQTLLIGEFLFYFSSLVTALLLRKYSIRINFLAALLLDALIVLLLIINTPSAYWLILIFRGIFSIMFWTLFNTIYYRLAHADKQAKHVALIIIIGPILGIIIPPVLGIIISNFYYNFIYYLSFVWLIILCFLYTKLPRETFYFNLEAAMRAMKKVRTLLFVEGLLHTVFISLITLVSLQFIKAEVNWGFFFAYLNLISIISSYVFAKISDRFKNRKVFMYPLSFVLAISLILMFFSRDVIFWTISVGLFNAIGNPFLTFSEAMIMDSNKNNFLTWAGRELILNMGRIFGILIAITCYLSGDLNFTFLIIGMIFLIYPLLIKIKKVYN